jgi:Protein of unknown function (DUF2490)
LNKLLTIGLVALSARAYTQTPPAELWVGANVTVAFQNQWQWHNDAGYRTNGVNLVPHQYLYRTGIRKIFSTKWNAAAGAAFFSTRISYNKADHEFGNEYRAWQEVNHQYEWKNGFSLQNRFRAEERFFEEVSTRDAYKALRLRYRVGLTKRFAEKWTVQVADEYMRQLQQKQFLYNQNRTLVSLGHDLKKHVQLQAVYIWQQRPTGSQHILALLFQKTITADGNKN